MSVVSGVGCQQIGDKGQKTVCLLSAAICLLCADLYFFLIPDTRNLTPVFTNAYHFAVDPMGRLKIMWAEISAPVELIESLRWNLIEARLYLSFWAFW